MRSRTICEIAALTAMLTILGAVKLPSFFPGAEFQLSAPLAVAVCAAFGFKRYIIAGTLSSFIGLILGSQNLLHVVIALIFRGVVGIIIGIGGESAWILRIAGPVASMVSRSILGIVVGKAVFPLILVAIPGMVYTALAAVPLTKRLRRIRIETNGREQDVIQRQDAGGEGWRT